MMLAIAPVSAQIRAVPDSNRAPARLFAKRESLCRYSADLCEEEETARSLCRKTDRGHAPVTTGEGRRTATILDETTLPRER
jgi:hypothetical protein